MKFGSWEVNLGCLPGHHSVDIPLSDILALLHGGAPEGWEVVRADLIGDPMDGPPLAVYNPDGEYGISVCPAHVNSFKAEVAM